MAVVLLCIRSKRARALSLHGVPGIVKPSSCALHMHIRTECRCRRRNSRPCTYCNRCQPQTVLCYDLAPLGCIYSSATSRSHSPCLGRDSSETYSTGLRQTYTPMQARSTVSIAATHVGRIVSFVIEVHSPSLGVHGAF